MDIWDKRQKIIKNYKNNFKNSNSNARWNDN